MDDLFKVPQTPVGIGGWAAFALTIFFYFRERWRKGNVESEAAEDKRISDQRISDDRRFRENTDYTIKYLQDMVKTLTADRATETTEFRRLAEVARQASCEYEEELHAEILELTRKCAGMEATLANKQRGAAK